MMTLTRLPGGSVVVFALAVLFSAALAFFLLRKWRDEMAEQMGNAYQRRRAEKDRLRSALAGEDQPPRKKD